MTPASPPETHHTARPAATRRDTGRAGGRAGGRPGSATGPDRAAPAGTGGVAARPRHRVPGAVALLAGALVAVSIGAYARSHPPTGTAVATFGFAQPIDMKVWLTTAAAVLALVQVGSALVMFTWPPGRATARIAAPVHRWSGRVAFLLTVPVAFHCLYALGMWAGDRRVLAHGLLGCLLYGAFVTKMLLLRRRDTRAPALALAGGLTFAAIMGAWATSALWFLTRTG